MDEYIEREKRLAKAREMFEKAKKEYEEYIKGTKIRCHACGFRLDRAVEVTRCADCQHCALEYTDQGFGYPSRPTRVCIIHDHETKLDDYCSWAKRKDEGK